jgi:glutamate dehydrogenase/leucine dehydrogenase
MLSIVQQGPPPCPIAPPPLSPPLFQSQPVHLHGSLGREAATGRGTVFAIREMLRAVHEGKIQDHTFVIQVGDV